MDYSDFTNLAKNNLFQSQVRAVYISTFGLCFGPILFCYYPLLMYGIEQAKSGVLPPYSVWLANIVCSGIGLLFIRRVFRY